ncbi:MAG TPA: patatin-like phospholipase family protein [Ktedonobacterales bacterium]|nr:patatin-like phospholipase family protein [Ktedonobacterales bacterium]
MANQTDQLNPHMRLDGVFEGGAVKGIALIGALDVIEQAGYHFVNVAGASAGAIVATLIAAGYSASELKPILMNLPFDKITDATWVGSLPLVGGPINLLFHQGLYQGDYFEHLMRDLLRAKGKQTFGDFLLDPQQHPVDAHNPKYRFTCRMVASDISRGRMLILPDDVAAYGYDPTKLDVARAVRMSMSIPLFFRPIKLAVRRKSSLSQEEGRRLKGWIVDGGLLSNFPVELFDAPGIPEWPTFGFKLEVNATTDVAKFTRHPVHGIVSLLEALFHTALEAHDAYYLKSAKFVRTIAIDTSGVNGTDFNLSADQKNALYEAGQAAAREFLSHWDFARYVTEYRSDQAPSQPAT